MQLRFKPHFDRQKLTWSRPDSVIAPFCSICSVHIPEDTVPLMMWSPEGACVQFCDECVEKHMEVVC